MKSPPKTCALDPLRTQLLKSILGALLSPITTIINRSITTGVFPEQMHIALVTPLLKKPGLDPNALIHFKLISNLSFRIKGP